MGNQHKGIMKSHTWASSHQSPAHKYRLGYETKLGESLGGKPGADQS